MTMKALISDKVDPGCVDILHLRLSEGMRSHDACGSTDGGNRECSDHRHYREPESQNDRHGKDDAGQRNHYINESLDKQVNGATPVGARDPE